LARGEVRGRMEKTMAKRETNEERWNRESLEIYEAVRKVVDGADPDPVLAPEVPKL